MKIISVIFITFLLIQICQLQALNLAHLVNRKQKRIIAGSMDVRANPCNDFLQYACGNWQQVFSEAGSKYNNTLDMLDYNVNKEMSKIFNKFSMEGKPKFIQEAFKYYKSCVNLKGYEPNMYLMGSIENEIEQNDWLKTFATMRRYGLNNIFIEQIEATKRNDSRTLYLQLDKANNFKSIEYNVLKDVVKYLDITDENALNTLWLNISKFENELQQLYDIEDVDWVDEEDYEKKHFISSQEIPFKWLKDYVKIILNQTELKPEMNLFLYNEPYIKALDDLLNTKSQTFLCHYLEIRFLIFLLLEEPFHFNEIKCLSHTRRLLPLAMHWLYEQQHPELLKEYQNIYDIYQNLRMEFNKTLKENKYKFNEIELEFLHNKLNTLQMRYNNIPRLMTLSMLENFYQDLNLQPNKFYENHLKVQQFNFQAKIKRITNNKQIIDDSYLEKYEDISTPYFLRNANILVVPLTLLQQPIYAPGLSEAYKYSTLGFLLAKDLFHGFNADGLLFSSNGSRSVVNLDENSSFKASLNCASDTNLEKTTDNIAYINGLRYAYQTFFSIYPEAINQTEQIHGKVISTSELFFLNFAQLYCEKSEKSIHNDIFTEAIINFPKFSETFDCRTNHLLYSHDVCHLW